MTTYWFRPKRYGYGATPITWQGWAVIILTALVMLAASLFLRHSGRSLWDLVGLLAFDALALVVLAIISYRKTDGEWRWRWGNDDQR